jgi:TPR repeat protein
MLTRVRVDVQSATNGKQSPWVHENLDADFFFVPKAAEPPAPRPALNAVTMSPEVMFWQSINGSTSAADYDAYLQQFPQGTFASLARLRIAALNTRPAPPQDETAWPEADRRAVQAALAILGQYRGPATGDFNDATRAAVRRWQSFAGAEPTGHLTQEERETILRDADLQAALLRVPPKSPRGAAMDSVKGTEARFNRGSDFQTGDGQPKDSAEAAYWYALAAQNGWPAAFTNLGTMYVRGFAGAKADIDAAKLLWTTASALGDGTAMFNLGVLAEQGIGMKVSLGMAKRWYGLGAERRHPGSMAALKRLGG